LNYSKPNREDQLIKELKSGNILAFNQLFEIYSSKLYLFSKGYLKSEVDSEELVQEVFTIIWEKRDQIKSGFSFRSYIFTIAFNVIKKHFRKKTLLRNIEKEYVLKDNTNETSEQIDYESLKTHILEIAESLPERRKQVFLKSRFEFLSNKEIAKEFGLSKKTVENHLNLALKSIKEKMGGASLSVILFYFLFLV
jgi:RNA polymerase sigma-70 factor (ECF subfamily)